MERIIMNRKNHENVKEIYIGKNVEVKTTKDGYLIVKISTVPEPIDFSNWLYGQTLPYLENDPDPLDWAYMSDYIRYVNKYPIID